MNQTFNLNRFAMLFKKHTMENYRMYLMSAAVLAGILLLFMGFVAYNNAGFLPENVQTSFFITFLLFAGTIFTSMIFTEMGDKKKAIPALTLPASQFEKYLVGWIYSFVVFQIVFVALFYLMAFIVIQVGHDVPGRENHLVNVFSKDQKSYYAFIIYTLLHGIAFLGAIYFEKMHFIKMAFAFLIGAFLLALLNMPIMNMMIDAKTVGSTIFSPVDISDGKTSWTIRQTDLQDYTGAIVLEIIVVLLWISAFFRLKEKEV